LLWNRTGYIHIYDKGPSIKDIRTKSRKIDSSLLVCKMSALAQSSYPLVRADAP